MIAEKQKNTNIGVGIGVAFEVFALLLKPHDRMKSPFFYPISLVGLGFFVWGCMNYSAGKGYSQWLGFIGLLSCIGLLILMALPDKNKGGGTPVMRDAGPPPPGVWPPPPTN